MAPTTAEPVTPISAAPKGTEAGVKKPAQKKKAKNNGFRNQNSRKALRKMHAFFKAHRDEYKDMAFGEQQKVLGKLWKESPENPKNSA